MDNLERFLRDLAAVFRARRLYPQGNPQLFPVAAKAAQSLSNWGRPVRIALFEEELIVEDRSFPTVREHLQPLVRELRKAGCETARIELHAQAADLEAWAAHLICEKSGAYQAPGVVSGTLDLSGSAEELRPAPSVLAEAGAGYLSLLSRADEVLTKVADGRPEGLTEAREIVRGITALLASGEDLVRTACELKDHDQYTFTHALNVCVLASALARAFGGAEDLVEALGMAALCHDLGKKRVPEEILNKPGRLEPEERRIMEGHPAAGAEMLLSMPGSSVHPLLPVVAYEHHVGANGSGYPRVEPCRPPHVASLIVSVADVFDALRTVRPYRPAWDTPQACTVLLDMAAGGELHRACVSGFFKLLDILAPRRPVVLSDGRRAVILSPGASDPLAPMVEAEDGRVLDLAEPSAPTVARVESMAG